MRDKLLKLWIVFFLGIVQPLYCQRYEQLITEADQLFKNHQEEIALKKYEQIYQSTGKYSLSMILKMAYLYEMNGQYSKALLFLNIFYHDQPNKRVLGQMEYLSEKYDLSGYKYTDLEYFISLYNEYYYYIIVYVLVSAIIVFIYLIIKKLQKKKLGLRPYLFIGILSFVYYITNYRVDPSRAIIAHKNTVLMSAPSAASEVIGLSTAGHRVTIRNKKDIWYGITWENKSAYVREDDLLVIPQNQKSLF